MKFEKGSNVKGAFVPRSALNLCYFKENEELELHTQSGAAVLTRQRMTAMELVKTIDALTNLTTYFINRLSGICGPCEACDTEGCPCDENDYIDLPDYLRQEACIPLSAKLCADVDEATHSVTIHAAAFEHDLSDVPEGLLAILREKRVCLGELEDRLMSDAIIYG